MGTHGLGAVLLTSTDGHVLIDGGLPESAPLIAGSIAALGFDVKDVRLIVNSHPHYDHAGGIAALQRASGARVAASPGSVQALRSGRAGADDPQRAVAPPYPAIHGVFLVADGDTLTVGDIRLVAHFTPRHTPGGTTWSWRSCEGADCAEMVYADSQTQVSDDVFRFSGNRRYPHVLQDFERGLALLEGLRCDVLVTPRPGASQLFERVAARDAGERGRFVDPTACRRYAAAARSQLAARVAREQAGDTLGAPRP